jgi:SAM-dependent methyltransferase
MGDTLNRLECSTEDRQAQYLEGFLSFADLHGLSDWEGWFSPYDEDIYRTVLNHLSPTDVVLDIGAGDLRLALRMAERVQRVYAIEVNPLVLGPALEMIGLDLPRNLHVTCANALDVTLPPDVTTTVLLMRHCQHFGAYFDRLEAAGCQRLLTNARWGSGVEVVDLTASRVPFDLVREGWYACRCGAVGYVGTGTRPEAQPAEVMTCPDCSQQYSSDAS